MIELTSKTKAAVERIFPKDMWLEVCEKLVKECGDNLPAVEASYTELAERIRFAVIKSSEGNYSKFLSCVDLAKEDWRDILVGAGFGDATSSHLRWLGACE